MNNKKIILIVLAVIIVLSIIGFLLYKFYPKNTGQVPQESITFEESEMAYYINLAPDQAKELIDSMPDLIIIDVSPKYSEGHLPKAVNYYIGDGSLDNAIPSLNKEKEYLVYCHTDEASMQGAQKLVDAGFKNVFRLEGNYKAWVDAGYPVEK